MHDEGMRALPLLLALALATACACEPEVEVPSAPEPSAEAKPAEPIVVSPSPEMAAVTGAAVARWAAASGIDLRIEEGGTPVLLKPIVVRMPDGFAADVDPQLRGTPTCGVVASRHGEIWLSESMTEAHGCPSREDTMTHELGHLLGTVEHMSDGITAIGLTDVCSRLHCSRLAPEHP